MAFPRKFLHEQEDVVIDRKPHVWFLARPFAASLASFALWVWLSYIVELHGTVNTAANYVPFALLVLSLLWFGQQWLVWNNTNFVVTTDRLIFRQGVVAKHGKEIPLDRINDITFSQSVFERIIGAGDLMIESGGENGQQRFTDINHPAVVQNEIYRQVERTQSRDLDRVAGRRQLSMAEQLEKLAELKERGVLTQAEFDAKKAQLLEQM